MMRDQKVKRRFVSLMFAVFAMSVLGSPVWAADDLTGTWTGRLTDPMGGHEIVLRLKAESGKITGTLTGGPPAGKEEALTDVRLEGDQLTFTVKAQGPQGESLELKYKGKVTGNRIQGTHEGPMGSIPWEVARK